MTVQTYSQNEREVEIARLFLQYGNVKVTFVGDFFEAVQKVNEFRETTAEGRYEHH